MAKVIINFFFLGSLPKYLKEVVTPYKIIAFQKWYSLIPLAIYGVPRNQRFDLYCSPQNLILELQKNQSLLYNNRRAKIQALPFSKFILEKQSSDLNQM